MLSPLKEIYVFNKYINTLRVKMAKRVRKTKKSPEDYQEQATRDMKIQKTMEDQEIKRPRTPARVRESARVKEGCQVSRIWKTGIIQKSKPRRISPNTTIFPPARGEETEKGKRDSSLKSMVKLSDDSSWLSLHP